MIPENTQSSSCADSQELQSSDIESKTKTLAEETIEPKTENEQEFDTQEFHQSEHDQNLYKEVLEKLDIVKKDKTYEQKQDIQEPSIQNKLKQEALLKDKNLEQIKTKIQVERVIAHDFSKIEKLMQSGLINSVQGQNLKKQVLQKAFDKLVQTEKSKRNSPELQQNSLIDKSVDKNKGFEEFSKSNPDFFTSDGRKEVLNYLKSGDVAVGKDELSKISEIVRTVEKAAIDRYLKKITHEKTLKNSNEVAKQKLTANAQKSSFSDKNLSRTFTREQIGKMSSAEFAKYESSIMEQLKKGLIH